MYVQKEIIEKLKEDMSSSPVDDIAIISRPQLEALEASTSSDKIAEAVISWMVNYDLLDAGNEYQAEDIIEVLNDLVPKCYNPIAEIVSAFGDPEAFGERELIALVDINKYPYGTKLYELDRGDRK